MRIIYEPDAHLLNFYHDDGELEPQFYYGYYYAKAPLDAPSRWSSAAIMNRVYESPVGVSIKLWESNNLNMTLLDFLRSLGFKLETYAPFYMPTI